jgi:hypothetical protein
LNRGGNAFEGSAAAMKKVFAFERSDQFTAKLARGGVLLG